MARTPKASPSVSFRATGSLLRNHALSLRRRLEPLRGQFWGEWFPARSPAVVTQYLEAVGGLLRGELRIVEHRRNGRLFKALLQRPSGAGWETVARHYQGFTFPWLTTEQRILQNRPG